MTQGIVYTETVIHSAPAEFVNEAPYQLVIVSLDGEGAGRRTGRIRGAARVAIGDRVTLVEESPTGAAWFAPSAIG
ncbi:MAG: hypothetical protein FJW31_22845 [Acidobacteria bacterium]|nr:hypothetical protein [Acidobacteriota bacterium]